MRGPSGRRCRRPRLDFAILAIGGSIYTFGGGGGMRAVEVYDTKADRWIRRQPMPLNNWCQVAAAAGGRIYVIGGGFPKPIPIVYEYDPQ
jgi:hypothetical protein